MATTGERLVEISTLTVDTALNHFLNIDTGGGGGGTTINIYAPVYSVMYLGESKRRVFYVSPSYSRIRYIEDKKQSVVLVTPLKIGVRYNKESKIKIRLICH